VNGSYGAPPTKVRGATASAASNGPRHPNGGAWVALRWLGVDSNLQRAVNWFGYSEGGGGSPRIIKGEKYRRDP
jgi:hypothetical protein